MKQVMPTEEEIANSVGIIDSRYRGNIIGMFDVLPGVFIIYIVDAFARTGKYTR